MGLQESTSKARSISTAEINFPDGNEAVDPEFFGSLAEFLWPKDQFKTDYELHLRTGATERMCRNWINASNPPNGRAIHAVVQEVLRRLG